ncbi:killer cell lectin-like receptor subfamily G member 1 [Anolis carolinensis]|uniref:killer cell lectin-like receptor subfamily G member 1 n=1 Tax=Anolis carolinensis TaxID=28377 RepID=UPI0002C88D95|nr:PREDICTED: killer cell lectin-like receptor subfamily G member 1 [Anolis carolinensis]|eukprot:XP_008102430.1 PREDICTED: killer cell lectin-like receptor subfamily G member 1 [Anolis carolinensis]
METRRPGSEVSIANSERDYENVIPSSFLKWQQQVPEQTMKARPDVLRPTTHTDNTKRYSWIGLLSILMCAFLLIAISAFVLAFLKFIPRCPDHWQKFQTKCYYFSSHQQTWPDADNICLNLAGHLVVVHDNATRKFLDHQQKSSYWLGLKTYAKGEWLWVDDTPLQGISKIKADNQTTECMYVNHTKNTSRMTRSSCSYSFYYICEKQQA